MGASADGAKQVAAGLSLVCLLPLSNLPSMGLLARLTTLGVLCVLFIVVVAITSAAIAGPAAASFEPPSLAHDPLDALKLLGTFSLSFFIHNCVITIFRAAANPQRNERNLSVSYLLVFFTYAAVGVVSNVCPPLRDTAALLSPASKNSFLAIPQPPAMAPMLLIARLAIVLQCLTVYPVLLFVVRAQFFTAFFYHKPYPGPLPVLVLNLLLVGATAGVTIAEVPISDVLRFTGAFASLVCVFTVPALVQWRRGGGPVWARAAILVGLLAMGLLAVVVQLLP